MKYRILVATISFIITLILITSMLAILGYTPFGVKSMATMDANIQYLDFFAYYRDLLLGKNSIFSMSYFLGGDNTTTIAYYLASPLNLLVIFFKKSQLSTFYNLLVVLKVSLSSLTIAFFLKNRFNTLRDRYVVLLAVSYAFMQYNIAQAANVIWLDGVYMLPILLLGIYFIANDYKRLLGKVLLVLGVFGSLTFNWYVGVINCLFAIFYFIFEYALYLASKNKFSIKNLVLKVITGLYTAIIGVLMSSFLFLPNIYLLSHGSRNEIDWSLLKNTLLNNPFEFMGRLYIGATSSQTSVSLYCGSLVIICIFAYFICKNTSTNKKVIVLSGMLVTVLMYYYQPLYFLFSLFKSVESYFSRYGYLGTFVLVFVAATFLSDYDLKKNLKNIFYGSIPYVLVLIGFNYNNIADKKIILSIILVLFTAIFLALDIKYEGKTIFSLFLAVGVITSLMFSFRERVFIYANADANKFSKYETIQEKQISYLKKMDSGYYRVNQTKNRGQQRYNLTANYNEGLAYNYWPITSYVSNQSTSQLDLINNLGYHNEIDRIAIANTGILGADTLLGVKYFLSYFPVKGYALISNEEFNDKRIYINRYAFPMSFTSDSNANNKFGGNPFDYQNDIYSSIYGKKIKLYKPVKYSVISSGSYEIDTSRVKDNPVYGNLPWNASSVSDGMLFVNNKRLTPYTCWLSPNVFNIPVTTSITNVKFMGSTIPNFVPQFYYLDLNTLKKVSSKVQKRKNSITINKNKVYITAKSEHSKQYANISIPYSQGWKAYRNGKEIKISNYLNSMMAINLEKGTNKIVLEYKTPFKIVGIWLTILGVVLFGGMIFTNVYTGTRRVSTFRR
ncbi:YfhO family protein [Ligilactobacillus equi]|uniref:YfhO family protein n=1 Tax=Ligilactobacillus equi TaxID=137357 RepID=UPI002ED46942